MESGRKIKQYFDNRIAEIHITNYMNVTNNTLLILKTNDEGT